MAFEEPPKKLDVVTAVYARGTHDLTTKQGCGTFTEAVVWALEQEAPGQWKHLKKTGGQNQWNGHGVDAFLHAPTGYAVDIIVASESSSARPGWALDKMADGGPRYKGRTDLQMEPFPPAGSAPTDPPVPPPVPPSNDLAALKVTVAALNARLTAIDDTYARELDRLEALIAAVDNKPAPPAPMPELPELVAEGHIRVFGYGLPVRLPVKKA